MDTQSPIKRAQRNTDLEYLAQFVSTRSGVRAYFEQQTVREPAALVLVASDGEWTRRRVNSSGDARKYCAQLEVPLFDVAQSGYPPEMREWNRRNTGKSTR